MSAGSERVVALRRLLDERYPTARFKEQRRILTGIPGLDVALQGGIPTGALSEFVSEADSAGNQLSLGSIVHSTRHARQRLALVDAANAFDLEGWDDDALAHVLWIRTQSLAETWRAADLVIRDPNYSLIVIDVRGFPERDLLKTKDSIWTRLQRGAEQAETAAVTFSTTAIVPNAAMRVVFREPLAAESLTMLRGAIQSHLSVDLQRSRIRNQEGLA